MPASTYTIVLSDEQTGRVVRRVNNLPEKTARAVIAALDGVAEVGGAVANFVDAGRSMLRALDQLAPKARGRRLPSRRARR